MVSGYIIPFLLSPSLMQLLHTWSEKDANMEVDKDINGYLFLLNLTNRFFASKQCRGSAGLQCNQNWRFSLWSFISSQAIGVKSPRKHSISTNPSPKLKKSLNAMIYPWMWHVELNCSKESTSTTTLI
ncbi:hypothetical protein HPP92_026990 [Vanilla planifolia]|uniref:Uncharacterized protein n=1 Tax=Vanilla planifolia TaxID=51239 RepID=A0A835PGN2_VANPL|nr:hypothetical protein HPP92_027133 [Vanilla planifolia]KAG0449997.1 hypothetical protein HPP92_026990 [Vanilla planifolia]